MHKFFKKNFIYYINIFFILSIWFCIDTNFENILSLKFDISIKNVFLSLRALGPFIIFFVLFFVSFIYKNKIQFFTKNKNLNFILIILYLNILFQFIGLLTTENNINNSYYIFVTLFAIFSVSNLYNKDLERINYLISLTVLLIIIFFFGFLSYKWVLTTSNLNMYGTFPHVFSPLEDFSSNVIRSSGLSRSAMIILIPLFYLILTDKIKLFFLIPYSNLVYLIPYIILSTLIYLCQSRIVVLFFLFFSFFAVFYFLWNKTKKYKIQKFFILIILPIIIFNSFIFIKKEINSKFYTNKTKYFVFKIYNDNFGNIDMLTMQILKENSEKNKIPESKRSAFRKTDPKSFSSNRISYWKEVILNSKKPIIGYGVLGDRFLIHENSSNALIYSYASGGIISTILMLILIIRYTYLCLFLLFTKKISLQKNNIFIFSSIFTISFLIFRGIGEAGFAVFSIDLLIFLSCITICEKFTKMKNNI